MQIRRLILYGRNGKVRVLPFQLGEVNVISGDSKTGKTALIDIVDYCLGSSSCNIAEGKIRDHVRMYGIVVAIDDEDIFICRPDPPTPQLTSDEIMVVLGEVPEIPDVSEFRPNFNPGSLKALLSEKMGFSDNLSEPGPTRAALEANFRHSLLFCFQQQGEIAQKSFLFHEAGDNFRALAIRDTLSYFLGAVDDERPGLRVALREATRQLALAERRLNEAVLIGGEGFDRGLSLLLETRSLGLDVGEADPTSNDELDERLRRAIERASSDVDLPEVPSDLRNEIASERASLMTRYSHLQEQVEAYRNLNQEETGFEGALEEQKQRLQSIGLFADPASGVHSCPMCGSEVELPSNANFQSALSRINVELEGVQASKPKVDSIIRNLEQEKATVARSLSQNRLRAEALAAQDQEIRRSRDMMTARARAVGRVELYLESRALSMHDESAPLKIAVERAQARVTSIQEKLDKEVVDSRLESILSFINRDITSMATELELEHSGNPLRFDPERLTIVADTINGPVPMSRMGSGENWVAYHVLTHLALHRWFHQNNRPVPAFIFFDQPSQVYFPSDTGSETDTDMNAVRRIYRLIIEVVAQMHPQIQVIITDHFDDSADWFQSCVIERWKGEMALIPPGWYSMGQA